MEEVKNGGFGSSDQILLRGRLGYAVRCFVANGGSAEVKQLRAGSWVRVQGKCTGKAFSGVVEMTGCTFVMVNR